MPKLAALPKGYLHQLCISGQMSLPDWIDLSAQLDIDGLEFFAGFRDLRDRRRWREYRKMVEDQGRRIAMMCCAPDFTHPDPNYRQEQIDNERRWIDMTADLGGSYCRILTGQRRPGVTREKGIEYAFACIIQCIEHAAGCGIVLNLENHYKDAFWEVPEFAQKMDVFLELLNRIPPSPNFGVNFDPSNTLIAGEDPLELLGHVKDRVVTMHASDRYLKEGTLEQVRREEHEPDGYARRLHHGEIGKGLNDYDAIFTELRSVKFDGWISIEDGVESFQQMIRSANFLRRKLAEHFPA